MGAIIAAGFNFIQFQKRFNKETKILATTFGSYVKNDFPLHGMPF